MSIKTHIWVVITENEKGIPYIWSVYKTRKKARETVSFFGRPFDMWVRKAYIRVE